MGYLKWNHTEAPIATSRSRGVIRRALPPCSNSTHSLLRAMDGSFRKIDIDQYDEDVLLESELYEPDPRDPAQVLSDAKQKAATVRQSLARYCASS